MKINTKPCHVIQLYSNSYTYGKAYKDYGARKEFVVWKTEIASKTFFDEKIWISQDAYENRVGVLDNLIVLLDTNLGTYEDYLNLNRLNDNVVDDEEKGLSIYNQEMQARKKLLLGKLGNVRTKVEIFTLKLAEEIELSIDWDYWTIGDPERENFKIAELKKDCPVNIKIDGKRDFSSTGRRKRTFIENNYVLEYKGMVNEVEVLKGEESFTKVIPKNVKEINLMKYLK